MDASRPLVCVDLGKTRCRVEVTSAGAVENVVGEGLPGLGAPDAAAECAESLTRLVAGIAPTLRDARFSVGAAGALAAPEAAAQLAGLLAARFASGVAVTSDVVTAHAGAFAGSTGVCLIVGTGAVALAVASGGETTVRDGRGLLAGDFGSGAWLGREALRAAEMARAGVGERTTLTEVIDAPVREFTAAVASQHVAARLAVRAPAVLAAARAADDVSLEIVARGARLLTETAAAAAADVGVDEVAVVGGIADDAWFRELLHLRLRQAGLTPRPPRGDAIAGARLIAERTDLPLEGSIHRARP